MNKITLLTYNDDEFIARSINYLTSILSVKTKKSCLCTCKVPSRRTRPPSSSSSSSSSSVLSSSSTRGACCCCCGGVWAFPLPLLGPRWRRCCCCCCCCLELRGLEARAFSSAAKTSKSSGLRCCWDRILLKDYNIHDHHVQSFKC